MSQSILEATHRVWAEGPFPHIPSRLLYLAINSLPEVHSVQVLPRYPNKNRKIHQKHENLIIREIFHLLAEQTGQWVHQKQEHGDKSRLKRGHVQIIENKRWYDDYDQDWCHWEE